MTIDIILVKIIKELRGGKYEKSNIQGACTIYDGKLCCYWESGYCEGLFC